VAFAQPFLPSSKAALAPRRANTQTRPKKTGLLRHSAKHYVRKGIIDG
jgi:hypothetical protein